MKKHLRGECEDRRADRCGRAAEVERMYNTVQEHVFPFIKGLHGDKDSAYSKYMAHAIFKIPTPLMLDKIVTAMDDIYAQMAQLKSINP